MAERAPEGFGRVSADDDRRMGRLRGPRPRLDPAKREEPTVILRLVLRPDREHRLEVLDRALPLVSERDAERVELGLQEPDPEAEDEAPAGDDVDARELLRQHQWIALRQDDDPGTELQALGVRRDERERDGRIEKRAFRVEVLSEAAPRLVADAARHGRGRHLRVRVRQDDVLARPDGLESGGLRRLCDADRRHGVAARSHVDGEKAELHHATSLRQRREVRAHDLPVAAAPRVDVGAAPVRGRRRAAALRAHGERVVPVEDAGIVAEGTVRPLMIDERRPFAHSHRRLQVREEARLVVEAVRGMIEHLEVVVERGDERARVTLVEGGDELLGERADIVHCGHVSLLSSRGMALWRSKARAAATVAGSPRRRLELTGNSRIGCRTRQSCRRVRHRHSPHTTSRSSRGRRAAGIRRARGLQRTLTMLRITDILDVTADCRETWTLRLEGTLKDEWVRELRRAWRRIREAAAGASIRVELADVPFVDPAGKVLLAEMYRDGVDIVATDCLGAAIRADIVDRSTRDRRAR